MSRKKIVVIDYNPEWAVEFEALKSVFVNDLGSALLRVEHVGSTSIVGMKAKPIIDLDIIIDASGATLDAVVSSLSGLGYRHVGNLGITGREAFKRKDDTTPDDGSQRTWLKHNLYVCIEGSVGLNNHLNFRNYLREHPEEVIKYSRLKQDLAIQFTYDIDRYIDGKTDYIVDVLSKVGGMKPEDLKLIEGENKIS